MVLTSSWATTAARTSNLSTVHSPPRDSQMAISPSINPRPLATITTTDNLNSTRWWTAAATISSPIHLQCPTSTNRATTSKVTRCSLRAVTSSRIYSRIKLWTATSSSRTTATLRRTSKKRTRIKSNHSQTRLRYKSRVATRLINKLLKGTKHSSNHRCNTSRILKISRRSRRNNWSWEGQFITQIEAWPVKDSIRIITSSNSSSNISAWRATKMKKARMIMKRSNSMKMIS